MTDHEFVLAIDGSMSGLSGDMLISSLIGLADDPKEVLQSLNDKFSKLLESRIELTLVDSQYKDYTGIKLDINTEIQFSATDKLIDVFEIGINQFFNSNEKMKELASDILNILIEAEREIHNKQDVHLHELGTSDTLIDILSTLYILEKLKIKYLQLSPLATGQGTVITEHGLLNVPPPVTDLILKKYKISTVQGPVGGEALTPTGAAIISGLKGYYTPPPNVTWEKTAFGFGNKSWNDRGNFVRLRLGRTIVTSSQIVLLESNIDDISGEILGYTMSKLMEYGALDVSYYPIFMKKNRPGYCLRVMSTKDNESAIISKIMELTGTLGIRIFDVNRHVSVRNKIIANVKINHNDQDIELQVQIKKGTNNFKLEYDNLIMHSERLNISPLMLEKKIMSKLIEMEEFEFD